LIGLEKEAQKYPHMLSGGNLRKLSSSLAIIGCQKCSFFDEPSVGLDPENRRKLWAVLQKLLQDTHGSIILSTHRMDEAESLCSTLGILICGQLFAYGTPASLKRGYGKGYRIYVKYDEKQNFTNCIFLKDQYEKIVVNFLNMKFNMDITKQINNNNGTGYTEIDVFFNANLLSKD